jgi:hypothetical protein
MGCMLLSVAFSLADLSVAFRVSDLPLFLAYEQHEWITPTERGLEDCSFSWAPFMSFFSKE